MRNANLRPSGTTTGVSRIPDKLGPRSAIRVKLVDLLGTWSTPVRTEGTGIANGIAHGIAHCARLVNACVNAC